MASIISYESMEEQPAKRAKLDGFTTSTSIFSTQGAIGSTILSDAQYPEMYAHYDNSVVNTSIMPLVQNIMLTIPDSSTVLIDPLNSNAIDTTTKEITKCEPGNFLRAKQTAGSNKFVVDGTDTNNTSLIIFADRPVMIKPGVYQIARAVAGVVSVHDDFLEPGAARKTGAYGTSSVTATPGSSGAAAAASAGNIASYVYHYNEDTCGVSGFHKIYLELNTAF